jgi:hypothetical protein
VSILKERAQEDGGTPAEESGLRAEHEELKQAHDAVRTERDDFEGAVQQMLETHEEMQVRASTLKAELDATAQEKGVLEERLVETLASRPRGGAWPSAGEATELRSSRSTLLEAQSRSAGLMARVRAARDGALDQRALELLPTSAGLCQWPRGACVLVPSPYHVLLL